MKKGFIVLVILLVPLLQAEEWNVYQSEHFFFYYKENHLTQAEIKEIAEIQEELFAVITNILNIEFKGTITYYLHRNRESFELTARAYCSGRTIHVLCEFCQDMCKNGLHDSHELTHALCTQINSYQCNILAEGVAVYMHNYVLQGQNVHGVIKGLHEQGELPPLQSIYFDFWSSPYNYYIAGSFVTFLIEEYGMEKFKLLYMGVDLFTVYNKPLDDLEQEWIETFTHAEVTPDDKHLIEYMNILKEGAAALYALGFDPGEYGTYPSLARDGICLYQEMRETNLQAAFQYLEQYNTAMIAWKDAIETFKKGLKTENIQKKAALFGEATFLYKTAGDWEMVEKSQKYAEAYRLLVETCSEIEKKHVKKAEQNLKKAEEILKELGESENTDIYHVEIQRLHQQLKRIKICIAFAIISGVGVVLWIKKDIN
ncbi:MAG: hypothetical protein PVF58_21850 [Candidatus Methanofastidiosia archaeon]|jgi:hypothetical protein